MWPTWQARTDHGPGEQQIRQFARILTLDGHRASNPRHSLPTCVVYAHHGVTPGLERRRLIDALQALAGVEAELQHGRHPLGSVCPAVSDGCEVSRQVGVGPILEEPNDGDSGIADPVESEIDPDAARAHRRRALVDAVGHADRHEDRLDLGTRSQGDQQEKGRQSTDQPHGDGDYVDYRP